ncbi:MAG: AAA family ATPase [Tannerella sp.]|jgi:exonuclease SbcC|nr:AAA family ATPase [Tannerella sp.]
MKILAIRGKNLASLENEFEIDFTSEPLCSAGIFVITGPTGAGKSTILDALCLALFDNAPRLNRAEQLKIEDGHQDHITLKDCRNILRKGASEGYAEVDFIALNGDKYRSQWTVRRARGRADGVLQNTSIRLENLSASSEEQGAKKDLLNRITAIIGLTFDQFTRAILLAQGDFAAFLKARQSEKAELLEKLTGTEIYSKVSALIYEKTGEAKASLELLKQRITDIKVLTDEESEALGQEKETLSGESTSLKQKLILVEKNINWLKQEEQLKQDLCQAANELRVIQAEIQAAVPRYRYMAMLDLSQEIRDTYIDWTNRQKQQTALNATLQTKTEEKKHLEEKFSRIEAGLKAAKVQLDELEQKYTALKPAIERAKELDIQIKSINENITALQKELDSLLMQQKTSEQQLKSFQATLQKTGQTKEALEKWLDEHEPYREIVPRIDLVINLIETAQTAKKQQENTSESLKSGREMLQINVSRLKQWQEEAERLNKLLPAEILHLRTRLEEGKPCPVCGSLHHPLNIQTDPSNSINEKELESAKTKIADSIATIKENIANTQKSITAFEVHIKTFQSQYETGINDLKRHLSTLPDWETEFSQGALLNRLTEIVRLWNRNKTLSEQSSRQIETLTVRIDAVEKNLFKTIEEAARKTDAVAGQTKTLNSYLHERASLLAGKSIGQIEKRYAGLKTDYTERYEHLSIEKDKAASEKASAEGIMIQLQKDITANTGQIHSLDTVIQEWLHSGKHPVTAAMLDDIMLKSKEWITQEKNFLKEIKEQELILSTTLKERSGRLTKHRESTHKPGKELFQEQLELQLNELTDVQDRTNKRLTEIQVALITHRQGKERIKAFQAELKTKEERCNDWARLNELLGSAGGNKFKTIAQGYTLDVLLDYANKHLTELTRRYRLEKIPGTLALQVIDNDMLGEVRTVHSLSGGESFLISLSLALGLSSLSSNRMKIESLFIDEGFGSLDINTLSLAMDALDNLRTQGRKIGVISHIEEMKERISTQIQVIKEAGGKSSITVIG